MADENGGVTDQVFCHNVARAKGDAELIIVEHTMSNYKKGLSSGILSFGSERKLHGMFDVAHAVKALDAKTVVQLSIGLGRELGAGPFQVQFVSFRRSKILQHTMNRRYHPWIFLSNTRRSRKHSLLK